MKPHIPIKGPLVFDISSEGLEPLKHRITGITTKNAKETQIFTKRDEKTLLQQFWTYTSKNKFDQLIGFNSTAFDIPMLVIRSIKNDVHIPIKIRKKHVDLRKIIFGGEEKKRGKLYDFANLMGITFGTSDYAKMHMSLLWAGKNLPELKEYLLRDVYITWDLYLHVKKTGLL